MHLTEEESTLLCRGTELAGDRASRVLAAVFLLIEGCVEALATDAARADALADGRAGSTAQPPVLLESVASRAMSSLQETLEAVLQYLEAAASGQVEPQEHVVLGAIRSLGR